MKTLLVDDNQENLYLLQILLQDEGHEIYTACNGQEASLLLAQTPFDLIVSDILMPVMDGFSLCKIVRQNADFAHIPIVFYTATYTDDLDSKLAAELGADDYIVKPCEPDELMRRIKAVINCHDVHKHIPEPTLELEQEILQLYNKRLVRKLEQKMLELENEVAQRNKSAEALLRSEKLLKRSQSLGKLGGWEYDIAREEMYWSHELYRLHDLDPDLPQSESLIASSLKCYPEDSRAALQKAIDEMKIKGTAYEIESWFTTFSGKRIFVRATAQAAFEDGKLVKINGILQDITESKEAQIKQEELREQLRQAQKLDSIGQLASGVAHDFNNVLTVILGYAEELLHNLHPQDPMYPDVQEILAAGTRASSLTRQLLTFSRKQSVKPQLMNLNDAINNISKMLIRLIGEDVEFVLELEENLPPVIADLGQIEQVIMNLVINAREAMPMGGRLEIKTFNNVSDAMFRSQHPMIEPGNYVVLKVSDTGTGMTKEIKEHVFEPFFTTKERGHGTGLGLPTCYGIVRQANGHIHVDTAPGKGARFVVLLPAAQGVSTPVPKSPVAQNVSGQSELILIVEDDPSISDLTGKMVHKMGYKFLLTDSADQALVMIQDEGLRPHLVLSDVVMPGLSGLELASILHFKHPKIKLLLMSGYTENVISKRGGLDAHISFVQKPFTRSELAEKIRIALGR